VGAARCARPRPFGVRTRADGASDANTLAVHAQAALLDAIASIIDPRDKEVAEAALCSNETYEGLPVFERRHKMEGLTEKKWDYRRLKAFKEIIDYLSRPYVAPGKTDQPSKGEIGRPRTADDERMNRRISTFVRAALQLHYAALSALFVQDIKTFVRIRPQTGMTPDEVYQDYIFDTYVAFMYGSGYLTIKPYIKSQGWPTRRIPIALYDELGDAAPIGRHASILGLAGSHTQAPGDIERELRQRASDDYDREWVSWYKKHCSAYGACSRQSSLVPFVAISGAIELELSRHFGLKRRLLHKKERLNALKLLAFQYSGIDDTVPVAGGLSMRQRAIAYFDVNSALLTDRARKWYARKIKQI